MGSEMGERSFLRSWGDYCVYGQGEVLPSKSADLVAPLDDFATIVICFSYPVP